MYFPLTFSPCNAGTESRKPWKLSLMWSLRLRSSALWCARLSACKGTGNVYTSNTGHTHRNTHAKTKKVSYLTSMWFITCKKTIREQCKAAIICKCCSFTLQRSRISSGLVVKMVLCMCMLFSWHHTAGTCGVSIMFTRMWSVYRISTEDVLFAFSRLKGREQRIGCTNCIQFTCSTPAVALEESVSSASG